MMKATVTTAVSIKLRAAALLVPEEIEDADFANLMRAPPTPFFHKSGAVAIPDGATADDVVGRLEQLLPSTVAMRDAAAGATILYARSFQGHHVTALLKPGADAVALTVKSTHPAQATALLDDVLEVMA